MIEAMKQWLEALEKSQSALAEELSAWDIDPPLHHVQESHDLCGPAITSLRQAIREHAMYEVQRLGQEIEQEPVCPDCKAKVLYECVACSSNNYPPQHTWVGLTDEDAEEVWQSVQASDFHDCVKPFAQGIEAKLKEKNT